MRSTQAFLYSNGAMSSKTGERKRHILQQLAQMLEQPHAGRITTAALARELGLSEAALYRHFASKAQMFEGLFDFIESTVFTLINQITEQERDGRQQTFQVAMMLLAFAERNRGMTRLLTGHALVTEDERLQPRIAHISDRIDATFRQCLRQAVTEGSIHAAAPVTAMAGLLTHFVMGCWLRFAQSSWQVLPTLHAKEQLRLILEGQFP